MDARGRLTSVRPHGEEMELGVGETLPKAEDCKQLCEEKLWLQDEGLRKGEVRAMGLTHPPPFR